MCTRSQEHNMSHKYKVIMSVINKQKYGESGSWARCALSLYTPLSAVARDFRPTMRVDWPAFYILLEIFLSPSHQKNSRISVLSFSPFNTTAVIGHQLYRMRFQSVYFGYSGRCVRALRLCGQLELVQWHHSDDAGCCDFHIDRRSVGDHIDVEQTSAGRREFAV